MDATSLTQFSIVLIAVGIFLLMWLGFELGRRYGLHELRKDPEATRWGTGVIDAGIFGLLGLLLAFTFSGASARLETRRQLIVAEANSIGTAWMRLDLLPAAQQPEIRELFRHYLEARISTFEKIPDMQAVAAEMDRAGTIQNQIWAAAQKASHDSPNLQTSLLVLPALADMFSAATTRNYTLFQHTPWIIIALLICAAMLSAVLAAYGGADKPRRKLHIVIFSAIIAITIYVIIDLEYPRVGLIRESLIDRALIDLRQTMK